MQLDGAIDNHTSHFILFHLRVFVCSVRAFSVLSNVNSSPEAMSHCTTIRRSPLAVVYW